MNTVRLGRVARALRRRKGWRQADVANAMGLTQQAVSLVERGHASRLALGTIQRLFAELGAELDVDVRWRGGELDRLLDAAHAALVAATVRLLERFGWLVRLEVTYSRYGERGSIDVVGYHPARRALLVVEVKSDVTSGEETLRKHDEKCRLAPIVVRERFDWDARSVSRLLVLPDTSAARRRIDGSAALFSVAYPLRTRALRSWLREPLGSVAAVAFLAFTTGSCAKRGIGGAHRVRRSKPSIG